MAPREEKLFAYGTLRSETVQRTIFGRRLRGAPNTLCGYRQGRLSIGDQGQRAAIGDNSYPILYYSGKKSDRIKGKVYALSGRELELADRYEGADYRRIWLRLASGESAWVYVAA